MHESLPAKANSSRQLSIRGQYTAMKYLCNHDELQPSFIIGAYFINDKIIVEYPITFPTIAYGSNQASPKETMDRTTAPAVAKQQTGIVIQIISKLLNVKQDRLHSIRT